MSGLEFVIDLGSSNVTIYQKGAGIVLKEPTVAVVVNGKKPSLRYAGVKAKKMLGKTVDNEQLVFPVKDGNIVNPEVAFLMMRDFLSRVMPEYSILKTKTTALVPVSCGLSIAERRAFDNLFSRLGFSNTILIDSPNTVSQFIPEQTGLIVNVGGNMTEFAITSPTGIINGCSLNLAGDAITEAVKKHLSDKEALNVGFYTAERVKNSLVSLYKNDTSVCEVTGRDYLGSPKTVSVSATDVLPEVRSLIDKICDVAKTMISYVPTEMAETVLNNGIYICGGTAVIPGLAEYLECELKLKINVINDSANAVVVGGSRLLQDRKKLNEVLNLKKI